MPCDTGTITESDPYAIAEGMDEQMRELQKQMVDLARDKAILQADTEGYGPMRTEAEIQRAMMKAKAVSHDRFLLENIKAGKIKADLEHLKTSHPEVYAGVVAGNYSAEHAIRSIKAFGDSP